MLRICTNIFILFVSYATPALSLTEAMIVVNKHSDHHRVLQSIEKSVVSQLQDDSYKVLEAKNLDSYDSKSKKKIFLGYDPSEISPEFKHKDDVYFGLSHVSSSSSVSFSTNPLSAIEIGIKMGVNVKKIVIIHSRISDPLIKILKESRFDIESIEVNSLKEALAEYERVFNSFNLENTLILVPIDNIAFNPNLMNSMIVEKSWSKKVPVYSLNPSLVAKGILFSGVPDFSELKKMILGEAQGSVGITGVFFSPLKKVIFNERVFDHFRLNKNNSPEIVRLMEE